MADLFQERGGTGGRSRNFFPLASIFARRVRHFFRWAENERADPKAAWMAARLNMAGISLPIAERGRTGWGFFFVAWVNFSSAGSASWSLRSRIFSWAAMTSK